MTSRMFYFRNNQSFENSVVFLLSLIEFGCMGRNSSEASTCHSSKMRDNTSLLTEDGFICERYWLLLNLNLVEVRGWESLVISNTLLRM